MHDHAARRRAALPRRSEAAPHASFDRELQLRIVHDHDDVLAAHFEVDFLERRRGVLIDDAADRRRSREGHDLHRIVLAEDFSDLGTAGHHVHHARGNAGFLEHLDEVDGGERRQ